MKRTVLPLLLAAAAHAQLFDYDKSAALHFTQKEVDNRDGVRLYSCTFDIPSGKATGYLITPAGPGRHPAIVWMHSNGALSWVPDAMRMARSGAVSLSIDTPSGGDTAQAFRDGMIGTVVGIRRAVDVLEARADVDPGRIAYVGHSFGAMMGADAVSVDRRFKTAVFEVGLLGMDVHIATSPGSWAAGVRKELGDKLPGFIKIIEVLNTSHYLQQAPHIPLLFQSARYDPGVPEKDAVDFYNIANQPKELKWYPTGHDVADADAINDRAQFLAKNLGLGQAGSAEVRKPVVVVITIDGFPAYALENDKLPIPTLRRLMKEGAWASRMSIINPAVTWPNHTTLVTGVDARKHGVLFNGLLSRDVTPPKVEPWVEKEKWVRARTVYDAAFEAGMTTAQVDWVAIYNAKTITWQFPEKPDPDGPIEREMEGRGIVSRQDVADFLGKSNAAWRDQIWTDAAAHIIREHKPNLLLFHLLNLDSTHHAYGPLTTASYAAIAYADSRVQQILDAIEAAGLKDSATVLVVSDHGFKRAGKNIRANTILKQAGIDADVVPEGGTAMVYNRVSDSPRDSPRDSSRAAKAFEGVEGIERVVTPADYPSLGLPQPGDNKQAPDLLLVAKDGYAFAGGNALPVVVDAPPGNGQHGYLNTDPEMDAIFIAWGRGIRSGAHLDRIHNVDVAPTIAAILGVPFPSADGHALDGVLTPK